MDLLAARKASASETSLLLLLLGAVVLHRLPQLLLLAGADSGLLHSGGQAAACGLSLLVLTLPGALVWGAHSAAIAAGSCAAGCITGVPQSIPATAKPGPAFLGFSLAYVSGPAVSACLNRDASSPGPCMQQASRCRRSRRRPAATTHHATRSSRGRCRWCGRQPWPTTASSSLRRQAWLGR